MAPDAPTAAGGLSEVATLLGVPDEASLAEIGVQTLRQRSLRDLLEASKRLGLSGVSKLSKEALVKRLKQALSEQTSRGPLAEPVNDAGTHAPSEEGAEP